MRIKINKSCPNIDQGHLPPEIIGKVYEDAIIDDEGMYVVHEPIYNGMIRLNPREITVDFTTKPLTKE